MKYIAIMAICAGFAAAQADNTRTNQQDRDASTRQSTPQNATATKSDLETLRSIRKAVTSDKELSTYAHNVKITVKNGEATLRGPVRSDAEKARIEEIAQNNGASSVSNQLEVAPPKK